MIDLDELREHLKVPTVEHDNDALLERLETYAVDMVQTDTGYHYGIAAVFIESVTGDGTGTLYLNRNPAAVPTEVLEVPEVGDVGEAITAAQADGWVRDGSKLLRKAGGVWTLGYRYQVTYSAGYAVGVEPGAVRQAVLRIVAILYRERGKEGTHSESIGGYAYSKGDTEIRTILDGLPRRPVLA